MKVCIVTFPISQAGVTPLSNLITILDNLSSDIYLITGGAGYKTFKEDKRVHSYNTSHKTSTNILGRAFNYILVQLKISHNLLKIITKIDTCIFFIGGEGLLLPLLLMRIARVKVVLALAGSPSETSQAKKDSLSIVTAILSKIGFTLANKIIVYSTCLIAERGLERHKGKISIAHEHFIDFEEFKVVKPLNKRDNIVGYIGRLSEEKGFLNFLEAILEIPSNIKFLVIGNGELKDKIDNRLVEYPGWIPHDELPKQLNRLKLLVLPSYTEGLPNIILEAMACGTPVLATPVGAIPDIIRNMETGFIAEDNSTQCLAQNIIKAIHYPWLEKITKNAYALTKGEYTYKATVARYRRALT